MYLPRMSALTGTIRNRALLSKMELGDACESFDDS